MAGLSGKEAEAIRKIVWADKTPDLGHKIARIQDDIRNAHHVALNRSNEAVRILKPDLYIDGTEVQVRGSLFDNMVKGLDDSGLISVLGLLEIRRTEVIAQYDRHVAELKRDFKPRSPAAFHAPNLPDFVPR